MADKPHVLIVEARYYEAINDNLLKGAIAEIESRGGTWEKLVVPGAFEVPGAIRFAHASAEKHYDAYVGLGCVIRGETSHYDHICTEVARGLMDLTLNYLIAVGFGVLTVENQDQAFARADPERKNKGKEAAKAALDMLEAKRHFGLGSA